MINVAAVLKRYAEILANNPRVAISPLDLDISCKCEQLLMSEPTFAHLNGSVGMWMYSLCVCVCVCMRMRVHVYVHVSVSVSGVCVHL